MWELRDISFHAGMACREMFDKPTIVICGGCWDKKLKETFGVTHKGREK